MRLILMVSAVGLLGACAWVPMEPGGSAVRVAGGNQDLAVCEKRSEIAVSVKSALGPIQRNELKVRDELETLARNEASELGADTVQPRSEPRAGEQRFAAFRCGPAQLGVAKPRPLGKLPEGEAETFPIED